MTSVKNERALVLIALVISNYALLAESEKKERKMEKRLCIILLSFFFLFFIYLFIFWDHLIFKAKTINVVE